MLPHSPPKLPLLVLLPPTLPTHGCGLFVTPPARFARNREAQRLVNAAAVLSGRSTGAATTATVVCALAALVWGDSVLQFHDLESALLRGRRRIGWTGLFGQITSVLRIHGWTPWVNGQEPVMLVRSIAPPRLVGAGAGNRGGAAAGATATAAARMRLVRHASFVGRDSLFQLHDLEAALLGDRHRVGRRGVLGRVAFVLRIHGWTP